MLEPAHVPSLTPDMLRAAQPPAGPVRFSMRDTPERDRSVLYREFFEFLPQFTLWLAANDRPRVSATDSGIWRRIMLPLSVPAIASLGLLTFVNTWNDYLGPLIYLRSHSLWTVQIGLKTLVTSYNAEYALIMVVAEEGARTFYDGTLGEALLALMKERGGLVTREDLAAYEHTARVAQSSLEFQVRR